MERQDSEDLRDVYFDKMVVVEMGGGSEEG